MAQLSSRTKQPMFRVPGVVLGLILVMVLAHVGRILLSSDTSDAIMLRFAFMPIRYAPGIDGGNLFDMAAPFLGYQFLHAGFVHLGMNMIWLLACGPVVARRFGNVAFLVFFFLCGIIAAAVFLACDWGGTGGMIGASGAVSGLMAAAVRMIPWSGMPIWSVGSRMPLAPLTSRPVIIFTVVWIISNLLMGFTGFGAVGQIHQIAWQAHIGGYLSGLLLCSVLDGLRPRGSLL